MSRLKSDLYDILVEGFTKHIQDEKEKRPNDPLLKDQPIYPSESYFYLQFVPSYSHRMTSSTYTGAFPLRLNVLQRTERDEHVDDRYCAMYKRMWMHTAVKYRKHAIALSLDDKQGIVVGNPGKPLAVVERGRRVLIQVTEEDGGGVLNHGVRARDHDAGGGVIKWTPTVTLIMDIPREMDDPWLRGDVYVSLKNAVFEPSTAMRSVSEVLHLLRFLRDRGPAEKRSLVVDLEGQIRSILLAITDGGSEHRSTFASVWIALSCLFRGGDFDYVCFLRTCPGQSWMNFVERIMSILNIALSGVVVMREAIDQDRGGALERAVAGCGSMKDLRALIARAKDKDGVDLKGKILESCEAIKDDVMARIKRRTLKGREFSEGPHLTDHDIDDVWELILELDGAMERGDTRKEVVKTRTRFMEFLKTHASPGT